MDPIRERHVRVLLLEAPYSYDTADILVGTYFPLGIGYLAAYLRKFGHQVRIFQPPEGEPFDAALQKELDGFDPAVVGISVMTPSYPEAVRLCDLIKTRPTRVTVLGGHHVSAVGEEVLCQSPNTDFVVIGEGEQTLLELVGALAQGRRDFSAVAGLGWRDGTGAVRVNSPRAFIEDIDSLPPPARDLVDMDRFRLHSYIDFGKKSATMITSRGCPFKCIFCSSGLTMGSRYRWRSAENVLAEVTELVDTYGVDHIVFTDDTMTLRRRRMLEICRGLLDMPRRPSWYCLSRVECMDLSLARQMRRAGCRMVTFGIESGSPEILEKIRKQISIDRAVEAVQACRCAGLRTECTFILGFPFDTDETMKRTLDAAKRINPTIAIFFPLMPYPGTVVFEEFMEPEMAPKNVDQWRDFVVTSSAGAVSVNPRHDGREISRLAQSWNRRYHFCPLHWFAMLRTVSSFGEGLRLLRAGLYLATTALRE